MGRTNPTFRDMLRSLEETWQRFRRGLRRDERQEYDRLFEYAREHADSSGYLNPQEPMHPVFLSIDLEQEKRLHELEDRVNELAAEEDQ